jgi:hypothetical protein
MKYVKRIIVLNIIIFISCLTAVSPANASGFIFNWDPFIVDADLALKNPDKETLMKNSSGTDISALIREASRNIFLSSADQKSVSTPKSEKKSVPGNIRISLFQANTFMANNHEMHTYSDDEQLSKFIDSLTSLIYDNSKIKSLETIGKIIEPQINFYLEF